MMSDPTSPSRLSFAVFPAHVLCVVEGVAEGDAISFADDLVMDDIYMLASGADRVDLTLDPRDASTEFAVAPNSAAGKAGNLVHLDCCLTLMALDGTTLEVLVLVEVEDHTAANVFVLPLGAMTEAMNYRLVGVDRHAATRRLAEASSVSLTRGTHITMADGQQKPVEQLVAGDLVLTRDDGAQEIRWIGQSTLRAVGAFAPVLIRKGALHNANDLRLSPDHRLFIYQREDRVGAGRAEVLVKVRHLINGNTVVQEDGGFIDYFQLLFDEHHIIYAEGIAAESLLLDPRTRAAIPESVAAERHAPRMHHGYEVTETLLSQPDLVSLLRRASSSG